MKKRVMKRSRTGFHQFVAIAASSMVEEQVEEEEEEEELAAEEQEFRSSVKQVERMLNYKFANITFLEAALTHSSYSDSRSYQRLEFIGDAALGLAVSNFVFITYCDLEPGHLSLLRAANISTEKLARVAVRHKLFDYVRHNAPTLEALVSEFTAAVEAEGDEIVAFGGGEVKAPKILADIVESVAAAVYVDCNFDLKLLWECFSPLLEPIVTIENLQQQPVTMLYELCQKFGKNVDFKHLKNGDKVTTHVMVDGKLLAASCSEQKDISKLNAAKEALQKLSTTQPTLTETHPMNKSFHGVQEINGAKQKLINLCRKNNWTLPIYSVDKEEGPSHKRRFICSVRVETSGETYVAPGGVKTKVKQAENSAASVVLHTLNDKLGLGLPECAS